MNDWKKDSEQRNMEKRKLALERSLKLQEKAHLKRVKILGRRFKCCICGKPATEPSRVLAGEFGGDKDFWSRPSDLHECNAIGLFGGSHWACNEHYHHGYCYNHRKWIAYKKFGVRFWLLWLVFNVLMGAGVFVLVNRFEIEIVLLLVILGASIFVQWLNNNAFYRSNERNTEGVESFLSVLMSSVGMGIGLSWVPLVNGNTALPFLVLRAIFATIVCVIFIALGIKKERYDIEIKNVLIGYAIIFVASGLVTFYINPFALTVVGFSIIYGTIVSFLFAIWYRLNRQM